MNKRKDIDVKSSKVVGIRLTQDEHKLLKDMAFAQRTTISDYARQAIIKELKGDEIAESWATSLVKRYWERIDEVHNMASYIVHLENVLKQNKIEFHHREFETVDNLREWEAW